MPLTALKLSTEEISFLREILLLYINSTNLYESEKESNTRARILRNAFFDLENNNVTCIELLK